MLGVATLIVVNSVMSGFSNKLKDRLHGILSDVRIETDRTEGFDETPDELVEKIRNSDVGHHVEALSPNVEMFALVQFTCRDNHGRKYPMMIQVRLVGVDPVKQAQVGGFSEYLVRQKGSQSPSFDLTKEAKERVSRLRFHEFIEGGEPALELPRLKDPLAEEPFTFLKPLPKIAPQAGNALPPPNIEPSLPPRLSGAIIGYSIAHYRSKGTSGTEGEDIPILLPGDEIFVTTVGASGTRPVSAKFIISDYFRSGMSEYDSSFLYVPIEDLQRMRGMGSRVNAMQMRLKDDVRSDSKYVHETIVPGLQKVMPPPEARVRSWEQQQGALLAAIDIERSILNILLFMIVGVAGFGVLAIFSMIVSEKYRDIGVMKSLGASNRGVMSIFLNYGFLLGAIGCVCGTILGITITNHINEIEHLLAKISGTQIFDRNIYYFDKIPTQIDPVSVLITNFGALTIAVVFSILPALRAARLHPVRALRFE